MHINSLDFLILFAMYTDSAVNFGPGFGNSQNKQILVLSDLINQFL